MTGYLVNFGIYLMAMLGLIFFALMVYKKFAVGGSFSKTLKNNNLSVEETMTIGPRKTLYIVKAGEERFLIAGDVDKTTLISKLDNNVSDVAKTTQEEPSVEPIVETVGKIVDFVKNGAATKNTTKSTEKTIQKIVKTETHKTSSIDDLPVIVDFQNKTQPSVLKDMLKKMNG